MGGKTLYDYIQDMGKGASYIAGGADRMVNGAPAPDLKAAAAATDAKNLENWKTAQNANHPNQFTPWGDSIWTEGPDGKMSQKIYMNTGDERNLNAGRDLAGGIIGAAGGMLGNQPNWGGIPGLNGDAQAYGDRAANSMYAQSASRLDPMWDKRMDQNNTRLLNMGLDINGEAARGATSDLNMARNDAYSSAMNNANIFGGQEASRMFGMDLQRHNSGISDVMTGQQYGINGINSALSAYGGTKVGMPQFGPTPQTGGPAAGPSPYDVAKGQYGIDQSKIDGRWDKIGDATSVLTSMVPSIPGMPATGGGAPAPKIGGWDSQKYPMNGPGY